jgi:16S rRNA (cytosine1402-N4)-methyltransferase
MYENNFHTPVLLNEAIEFLFNPEVKKQIIVDGTTGGGGYSEKICELLKDDDELICLDKDIFALDFSEKRLEKYADRTKFINRDFGDIKEILQMNGIKGISGLVLDLGLSSYQLNSEDGFSFMKDTLLDMRADKSKNLKAENVLNEYSKDELLNVFEDYGEIGNSKRLVECIMVFRRKSEIKTTFGLVNLIKSEYKINKAGLNDFLAKIFQAIRIEVNNELENLKNVLSDSLNFLVKGGRVVVISYHSLEDRIIKNFFKLNSFKESVSKYKENSEGKGASLKILTKKPLFPSFEEIKNNPRSRSAKLRAAEKI